MSPHIDYVDGNDITNTLHRPVCDLLGCRWPIVLAGMGGVARAELCSAVTRAGGFGFLGMVREPTSLIRSEVQSVRAATSHTFGVNLIPASTPADLLEEQIATCIEIGVTVVGLFWDVVPQIVRRLRDAGVLVVYQIGSLEDARAAEDAGAQILIAQGREAGGHVRGDQPLAQLIPKVVSAAHVPVLAAGGLANGADVAAALSLGAQGVVLGTVMIPTHESFAHAYHKQRIIDAAEDDTVLTDIFHINWPRGARVRVLQNSVTRGERGDPFGSRRTVIGDEHGRPIYLFSTDSPLRSMTGDFEAMALYAGTGAARIGAITSAAERLYRIASDAAALVSAGHVG
ncbi:2-nitropropane dioxygenase [Paraburkholderia hospita]|nr:2-nitropropane dioxygenase [Paraburkholderia hospita]